jgi:hypothetical protein
MNPSLDHDEKLERLIHRTLRDLPRRRAPGTLEARVLAELERRAALPWWHKSYAHWPVAVRVAFLVGTAAVAAGLVAALFSMMHVVNPAQLAAGATDRFAWLATTRGLLDAGASAAGAMWRSIPPLWLFGAFTFVAACYATLLGVGAAAYRTLHVQR